MFQRRAHPQLGVILAVLGVTAGAIALSQPGTATAEVVLPTKNQLPTVGSMSTPSETIHTLVRRIAKKNVPTHRRSLPPELAQLRRAAMFGADPLGERALTVRTSYDAARQEQRIQLIVRAPLRRSAALVADFHARTFVAYWWDAARAKYEYALAYLRQLRDERAAEHHRALEDLARCRRDGSSDEVASAEARVSVTTTNLANLTQRLTEASRNQPWLDAAKQVTFASSPRIVADRGTP